jgi:hypothetical protein
MGLKINGSTSGSIEIDVPAVAGTDTAITIPAVNGGEFIVSDSSGNIDLGALDISGSAAADSVNIDASGRLLAGTSSSPSAGQGQYARLAVQGYVGSGGDTGGAYISLQRGEAATAITAEDELGFINFGDSAGNTFGTIACRADATAGSGDYPGRLVFSTTADGASSPTERMRIRNDGFVKISNTGSYFGLTSTYHELNNNTANWIVVQRNSNAGPYGVLLEFDSDPNGTSNPFWRCRGAGTTRAELRSNGGIANYSANNANLCDEREKKNIETLDSTWGCLKNWELKKFHYNEDADTDDKHYGVIAQQVASHCPEVITDWVKQKAEDAVLDEDGNIVTPAKEEIVRMGVKEQQMMWMAIKALQEAQLRIETLETANASQAATIAALDARLTALEGGAS